MQPSIILQFDTVPIAQKAAICLEQIAAFLSTKTHYLRLLICDKPPIFKQFTKNILLVDYSIEVCRISKNPCLILIGGFLNIFHHGNLNEEGYETKGFLSSVWSSAVKHYDDSAKKIFNESKNLLRNNQYRLTNKSCFYSLASETSKSFAVMNRNRNRFYV